MFGKSGGGSWVSVTEAEKASHGKVRFTVQVKNPKMDQKWWYGIGLGKYNQMV